MKQTVKILCRLLDKGELCASDAALIADFRNPEVRQELDEWGEEMGFTLLDMRGKIYLIPDADSNLLSFTMQDIREAESKNDRMIDAFLQCYITMTILWLIYGGKNNQPKQRSFVRPNYVIEELDKRFLQFRATDTQLLEEDYEINFQKITEHWLSLQIDDDHKRKTRKETVMKAFRLLERQRLLNILEEGREIRPTDRLDDLMAGHYLKMERVEELHKLFDQLEEQSHAEN